MARRRAPRGAGRGASAPPDRRRRRARVGPLGWPGHGAWRSLVSALVWGTRGPEFESRRPDWDCGDQAGRWASGGQVSPPARRSASRRSAGGHPGDERGHEHEQQDREEPDDRDHRPTRVLRSILSRGAGYSRITPSRPAASRGRSPSPTPRRRCAAAAGLALPTRSLAMRLARCVGDIAHDQPAAAEGGLLGSGVVAPRLEPFAAAMRRPGRAQIVAPLRRLHVSHRSSRFRAVFDPPLLNGMMWSNSRFSREPQSTQRPLAPPRSPRRPSPARQVPLRDQRRPEKRVGSHRQPRPSSL